MFKRINGRTVSTDPSFIVSLTIDYIEYSEGDKLLKVPYDRLVGNPRLAIYTPGIELWEPPYQSEPITPEKKQEIIANICSSIEFNEMTYMLV